LVYQAFETLSNPESRKKYDHQLAASAAKSKMSKMSKASAKTQTVAPTRPDAPSTAPSGSVDENFANVVETKFLRKLHELLKRLPRDLRQEVFEHDFSQKQRLLLEKWMVGAPADSVPMLTQCSNNRKQHNEAGSWFQQLD
jgi:curved DNA-binding protein CbpA